MSRPRTSSIDRPGNADGRDADATNLVPSSRQYLELKAQHPGAILLSRLGDFYETVDDDATILARDARIALTSRSFGRFDLAVTRWRERRSVNSGDQPASPDEDAAVPDDEADIDLGRRPKVLA